MDPGDSTVQVGPYITTLGFKLQNTVFGVVCKQDKLLNKTGFYILYGNLMVSNAFLFTNLA